jgi:hypothetical protein
LEIEICNRFPAITPFSIRKEKISDVFLLVRRLRIYDQANIDKKKKKKRRPASDSWF